jgi:ribosomal protein L37E
MAHEWQKIHVREASTFHIAHIKCAVCGYFFMKRFRKGLWSIQDVQAHVLTPDDLAVVDHIDCDLTLVRRTSELME